MEAHVPKTLAFRVHLWYTNIGNEALNNMNKRIKLNLYDSVFRLRYHDKQKLYVTMIKEQTHCYGYK